MSHPKLERLLYQLERTRSLKHHFGEVIFSSATRDKKVEAQQKVFELRDREQTLLRRIIEIEDCEHSEVVDTGGPDGSQVCLQCGLVR